MHEYLKLCLLIGWKLQREKEKLHKRIIELEKKLDAKQVLELERANERCFKGDEPDG